jgi:hypothetical protein
VLTADGISFSTSTSAHFIGFGLTSFYLALSSLSYFLSPFLENKIWSTAAAISTKCVFRPTANGTSSISLADRYPTMNLTLRGDRDCVNGQTSGSYRV